LLRLFTALIVIEYLHSSDFNFLLFGFPNPENYLFLNDLVVREKNGLNVILLLQDFVSGKSVSH
jgi:hypothetical protein